MSRACNRLAKLDLQALYPQGYALSKCAFVEVLGVSRDSSMPDRSLQKLATVLVTSRSEPRSSDLDEPLAASQGRRELGVAEPAHDQALPGAG